MSDDDDEKVYRATFVTTTDNDFDIQQPITLIPTASRRENYQALLTSGKYSDIVLVSGIPTEADESNSESMGLPTHSNPISKPISNLEPTLSEILQIPGTRAHKTHKVILAGASRFFERYFDWHLHEVQEFIAIELETRLFEPLLLYMYTSTLTVPNLKTAIELISHSDYFEMPELTDALVQFIEDNQESLKMYLRNEIGDEILVDLQLDAFEAIINLNYPTIFTNLVISFLYDNNTLATLPHLSEFTWDQLWMILSRTSLPIDTEMNVFAAIDYWFKNHSFSEEEKQKANAMWDYFRPATLTSEEFAEVRDKFPRNTKFHDLMAETYRFHEDSARPALPDNRDIPRTGVVDALVGQYSLPRRPGFNNGSLSTIFILKQQPERVKHSLFSNEPEFREGFLTTFVQRRDHTYRDDAILVLASRNEQGNQQENLLMQGSCILATDYHCQQLRQSRRVVYTIYAFTIIHRRTNYSLIQPQRVNIPHLIANRITLPPPPPVVLPVAPLLPAVGGGWGAGVAGGAAGAGTAPPAAAGAGGFGGFGAPAAAVFPLTPVPNYFSTVLPWTSAPAYDPNRILIIDDLMIDQEARDLWFQTHPEDVPAPEDVFDMNAVGEGW